MCCKIIGSVFDVFRTSLIRSVVNTVEGSATKGGTINSNRTKPLTFGTLDSNTKI